MILGLTDLLNHPTKARPRCLVDLKAKDCSMPTISRVLSARAFCRPSLIHPSSFSPCRPDGDSKTLTNRNDPPHINTHLKRICINQESTEWESRGFREREMDRRHNAVRGVFKRCQRLSGRYERAVSWETGRHDLDEPLGGRIVVCDV